MSLHQKFFLSAENNIGYSKLFEELLKEKVSGKIIVNLKKGVCTVTYFCKDHLFDSSKLLYSDKQTGLTHILKILSGDSSFTITYKRKLLGSLNIFKFNVHHNKSIRITITPGQIHEPIFMYFLRLEKKFNLEILTHYQIQLLDELFINLYVHNNSNIDLFYKYFGYSGTDYADALKNYKWIFKNPTDTIHSELSMLGLTHYFVYENNTWIEYT